MASFHTPTGLKIKNFLELTVTVEWDVNNIVEYRHGELRSDLYYKVYTSTDGVNFSQVHETRHKYATIALQTEPFQVRVTAFTRDLGESDPSETLPIEVTMNQIAPNGAVTSWASLSKKGARLLDLDVPGYRGNESKLLQVALDGYHLQWKPITWSESTHLHDDRYYPRGEANAYFYSRVETDALLDTKSDVHPHPYQLYSERGTSNGYCELDAMAKIPANRVPDFLLGQVVFKGVWDASSNTPDVGAAADNKGYYYVTTVGGTQFGLEFTVGDWIISDGTKWDKVDNTDAVPTVFGRIGNIVAGQSDYQAFYSLLGHTHTKAEAGLALVDNTPDTSKPVSVHQQAALDLKANISNPTFTGTVSGISKAMVGLGNADDTSDINKPISTAQQAALDLKSNIHNPTFTGVVSGVTAEMVGLGNVNNVSDINKPISSATQFALDLKAPIASPNFTGTVTGISKAMVGLGNVDNTSDISKPISTATQNALNTKSDAGHDHASISGSSASCTGNAATAAYATSAGNSDLLDGYHASTTVAGNTVLLRDPSGYSYHNYINMVADTDGRVAEAIAIRGGGDTFIRWRSPGGLRSDIGAAAASHDHSSISGSSGSCTGNSATASYASSAGNSDTLDGQHANAFATASHDHSSISGSSGSCTGNAATANYASSAGNADTLDGYHSGSFAPASHDHGSISGSSASCSGNSATATYAVSAGTSGSCTGNAATASYANSAGVATSIANDSSNMVFHWSGQAGQPAWLWGGGDGVNMYVYNPSNFSVAYAASSGGVDWSGVSNRPTSVSSFTNDSGYITAAGSCAYATSAGSATSATTATTANGIRTSAPASPVNGDIWVVA